ncbi:NADH:ubiquinone reductase (Na(+)-transporting) subunit F [Aquamicrobium defluvii]|uniref:Na(+)-translocating NADH-quinone reductase subunit F n=1 Tax=Aquamicrobium defluvii TaxID=69279 RepID=A0A011SUV9_9HYPH|nr:NADH:ubiquinone reductase (Na(+)-transporting) subunit F [Aquamicrobium defluvii]EXL03014.1 Na(+)-translocating NADH-quinone reductase subunit F [Aquamicrobium defluvii]EZQ13427.1 Na(+)-translocating NADH-quinone reductase subunit F [Halopseudomonas bauzanensis]
MTEIAVAFLFLTGLTVLLAVLLQSVRARLLPSWPVSLTINGHRRIEGLSNEKLLDVLNAAGIPVPSGCAGQGTCGLCRVCDVTGTQGPLATEAARLSAADLRAGVRLACQVTVRSDMKLTVPEDVLGSASYSCTVASTRSVTPLIREIVLALPEGADFNFRAGNFVQVTAPAYRRAYRDIDQPETFRAEWQRLGILDLVAASPEPVSRAYSVASRPQDKGNIVLNIRLATPPPGNPDAPPGIVSSWLFGLAPGDEVGVAGPYGEFRVQDTDKEMIFIGGGVGMAPLRAMIHEQLGHMGTRRKMSFWYGARSKAELFYAQEFEALAARHPNFRWVPALSQPARGDDWHGAAGFIHDVVFRDYLRDHPEPENCEYYLCGPPLMIQAVYAMLDDCGVDPEDIHNDDFGI